MFCPNGDVQETGASNFILIKGNEIITKPLTDEFLHGVTRDSVLTVAKDLGYTVSERNFTVDELKAAVEEGAEAILTGTAAVISPVTSLATARCGDYRSRISGDISRSFIKLIFLFLYMV